MTQTSLQGYRITQCAGMAVVSFSSNTRTRIHIHIHTHMHTHTHAFLLLFFLIIKTQLHRVPPFCVCALFPFEVVVLFDLFFISDKYIFISIDTRALIFDPYHR